MSYAPAPPPTVALDARLRARFERAAAASDAFFAAHAEAVALACRDMASRFHRGGRLFAFGTAASASDARHVSVEFVHPVLVGKRALPALALEDPRRELPLLGRPADVALALEAGRADAGTRSALEGARSSGMLTLALVGGTSDAPAADHVFAVPDQDPTVVQEIHETLYHVLWELTHVFLDHEDAR
ncbi:MAG: phosphoheptose isomerase [Gemmatimonadetes bacterium]|nr:phosphoheptose isomerase [Gemmatimonadota bacterium]